MRQEKFSEGRRSRLGALLLLATTFTAVFSACGSSGSGQVIPTAAGGSHSGGNTGGVVAGTGGSTTVTGGITALAGATGTTTGGTSMEGGTIATGGLGGAGGVSSTGGKTGAGGAPGTGGSTNVSTSTGGITSTGGKSNAGGASGGGTATIGDAGRADSSQKDVSVADSPSTSDIAISRDATSTGGSPGSTCSLAACATCGAGANLHNLNNDNWAGSLTLFISYSADTRSQTVDKGYTSAQWNAAVNSFDVPSFATQVQATGAKNILLMLGQNTGFYCSPNSVYENYAGVAPGTRCSVRDLPMEIADALAPMGIGMYLYLPEDVGWGDTKAASNFGLTSLAVANWVVDSTFTPKWNAVLKTWADRYGTKVKGWFFDGYEIRWGVTQAMAQTYRTTCLTANPCGVVLFNGGSITAISDTQRGETKIDTTTGLPAKGLPTSRWDKSNLQVMWDFPLQAAWGQEIADDSPAIYTNANLKTFITAAIKAQAVFALDVRTSLAGKLSTPIYNQLLAIKQ
jgi:hypothetical protein